MGNSQAINSLSVSKLIKKLHSIPSSKRVTLNFDNDSLKFEIPISKDEDDIVQNFILDDNNYKNVILSIGSSEVQGTLKCGKWEFPDMVIPLFHMNEGECKFVVYPSPKTPQTMANIDISYDTFPRNTFYKDSCSGKNLHYGNVLFTADGCAF